jgi:hypothetical protein
MAVIIRATSRARNGERLAWARSGPNSAIICPSGASERVRPDADAGKEMALGEPGKIGTPHISNRSIIDFPGRDQSARNEIAQPLRGEWFNFVVVGCHAPDFP